MPTPLTFLARNNKVSVGINNPDPTKELDITGDLAVSGTITAGGSPVGSITMAAVGSTPNDNGASASGTTLTLQPADGTHPGVVTSGVQTIGGAKTFSGAISASNLSGTNTGNVTLAAVGAVPNANGASLSGQALNLQPADGSNPGVVTTASQTFAGAKTFSNDVTMSANLKFSGTQLLNISGSNVVIQTGTAGGVRTSSSQSGQVFQDVNASGIDLSTNTVGIGRIKLGYTDTSGSPGSATANTASGRSAIANGATTCTVTNSVCTSTSTVMVTAEDGLDTVVWFKCVPGSGSFVVTVKTDPGATWKFRWVVFNG